jgi:hypothetical protein
MKLNEQVFVPLDSPPNLAKFLFDRLSAIAKKVNGISSGNFASLDGIGTAAPTTGTWAQGDFIRNSAPVEAGSTPDKYVVFGFVCTVGGTPGTWLQVRTLTGN